MTPDEQIICTTANDQKHYDLNIVVEFMVVTLLVTNSTIM